MRTSSRLLLTAFALGLVSTAACQSSTGEEGDGTTDAVTGEAGPEQLTYDELVTLSGLVGKRVGAEYVLTGAPAGLQKKLNDVLDTPRISNAAFERGARRY